MLEIYATIAKSRLTLFAAIIEKHSLALKYNGATEPYDIAAGGLCTMFNYFLRRGSETYRKRSAGNCRTR